LSEITPAANAPADASAPRLPHEHDPGRGPADIRAIIAAHRDDARACYDQALLTHPLLEGDLVVQWTIDPKGNVVRVALDSTRSQIQEPALTDCVADVVRAIRFAPSPGGFETKAWYPFNFHPRGARVPASGASHRPAPEGEWH
jgi:hypothetical protein